MTTTETARFRRPFAEEQHPRFAGPCVENAQLCDLVLAAVRQIDLRQLIPVTGSGAGMACQPPVLLGLLTYCYACGVFGSQEIAARVARDPILILLCGRELPDWHVIRRFRRYNREAIQRCLEATLYHARRAGGQRAALNPDDCVQRVSLAGSREVIDRERCGKDAWERVHWAIYLDHMFLDE